MKVLGIVLTVITIGIPLWMAFDLGHDLWEIAGWIKGCRRDAYLLKNGEPGQATIAKREETNTFINERQVIRFTLRVQTAAGGEFETKVERPISVIEVQKFEVGTVHAVKIDAKRKHAVFVPSE